MQDSQSLQKNKNFSDRLTQLKTQNEKIHRIASDYLISLDVTDFIDRIIELDIDTNFERIPKVLLLLSFDRKDIDRKRIADLIIDLYLKDFINSEDLAQCFRILLTRISDLMLDIPQVVTFLEYFVNRFIDNKCLEYGTSKNILEVLSIYSGSNPRKALKKIVEKILNNYFVSEELEECIKEIEEINDREMHPLIVKYTVSLAFDKTNHERELVSRLLARAVDDNVQENSFISRTGLEEGMIILLNSIQDLYDDVPYVYEYLSFFIARAIHDEGMAPAFTKNVRSKIGHDGLVVIEMVESILNMETRIEELPKIWDSNIDDINQIKRIVKKHVKAFFDTGGNGDPFRHFMHELNHPHYHYEVIYQLFCALLLRSEEFIECVSDLIDSFYNSGISSKDEIVKGFTKIRDNLEEMAVDHPNALAVYEKVRRQVMTGKID